MENINVTNSGPNNMNEINVENDTAPASSESGNSVKQKLSNLRTDLGKKIPIKLSPLVLIAIGLLCFLFIPVFFILLYKRPTSINTGPSPTTISQTLPSVSPVAKDISNFAMQPEFTEFENQLNILRQDNEKADFTEPQLAFPLLDMNVNYKNN